EGVLSENEKIKVKLVGVDQKTGKFKLSRKVLMPKPEGMSDDRRGEERQRREERPRFDNRRDERKEGDRPKIERSQRPNNEGQPPQGSPERTE
ncbi:MAG: polyribonucleotide nucleotidyltransferase, partial [Bacteroidota bacterium]|nr:polyribonucleotide nucleotidyltransferase [Bacteroidota bacterium]